MRILCVCAQGVHRSGYAARYFSVRGHETRHKGVGPGAEELVSQEDLDWAETIVYAAQRHRKYVHDHFATRKNEFILGVSDDPAFLSQEWALVKATNPEKFYEEYTYPKMRKALSAISLA